MSKRKTISPPLPPGLTLIHSIDDPLILPYTHLKERDLANEGNRFIAESEHVVRRLLAAGLQVESLFVTPKLAHEIAPLAPPQTPILVAEPQLMNRILGYRFHSGVLACAVRPASPTIADLLSKAPPADLLIVVCPDLNNTENLGSIIRISSAFGASAILLGPESCDPYYRQSVRVSMGTVFNLPVIRSTNLLRDLEFLRSAGLVLAATLLAPDATPLARAPRWPRMAILFGSEAQGLSPDIVALAHHKLTIPMQLGTDSLNVAVAAGITLYHFSQYAPRLWST